MIVSTELTLNVQMALFYMEEMNKPLEALITCLLAWLEKSNVYHPLLKHMEPGPTWNRPNCPDLSIQAQSPVEIYVTQRSVSFLPNQGWEWSHTPPLW